VGAGSHPFRKLVLVVMGAQKGHSKAQFNLAVMLEEGRGQAPDMRKAFHWYEKAAQQGESNAQYNLALLFTLGKGYEADLVWVHMFFCCPLCISIPTPPSNG